MKQPKTLTKKSIKTKSSYDSPAVKFAGIKADSGLATLEPKHIVTKQSRPQTLSMSKTSARGPAARYNLSKLKDLDLSDERLGGENGVVYFMGKL